MSFWSHNFVCLRSILVKYQHIIVLHLTRCRSKPYLLLDVQINILKIYILRISAQAEDKYISDIA